MCRSVDTYSSVDICLSVCSQSVHETKQNIYTSMRNYSWGIFFASVANEHKYGQEVFVNACDILHIAQCMGWISLT